MPNTSDGRLKSVDPHTRPLLVCQLTSRKLFSNSNSAIIPATQKLIYRHLVENSGGLDQDLRAGPGVHVPASEPGIPNLFGPLVETLFGREKIHFQILEARKLSQ